MQTRYSHHGKQDTILLGSMQFNLNQNLKPFINLKNAIYDHLTKMPKSNAHVYKYYLERLIKKIYKHNFNDVIEYILNSEEFSVTYINDNYYIEINKDIIKIGNIKLFRSKLVNLCPSEFFSQIFNKFKYGTNFYDLKKLMLDIYGHDNYKKYLDDILKHRNYRITIDFDNKLQKIDYSYTTYHIIFYNKYTLYFDKILSQFNFINNLYKNIIVNSINIKCDDLKYILIEIYYLSDVDADKYIQYVLDDDDFKVIIIDDFKYFSKGSFKIIQDKSIRFYNNDPYDLKINSLRDFISNFINKIIPIDEIILKLKINMLYLNNACFDKNNNKIYFFHDTDDGIYLKKFSDWILDPKNYLKKYTNFNSIKTLLDGYFMMNGYKFPDTDIIEFIKYFDLDKQSIIDDLQNVPYVIIDNDIIKCIPKIKTILFNHKSYDVNIWNIIKNYPSTIINVLNDNDIILDNTNIDFYSREFSNILNLPCDIIKTTLKNGFNVIINKINGDSLQFPLFKFKTISDIKQNISYTLDVNIEKIKILDDTIVLQNDLILVDHPNRNFTMVIS